MKKGDIITLEQLREDLKYLRSNPFSKFIKLKERLQASSQS